MQCYLSEFQHIRPHHEIDQEVILDWIADAHAKAASCLQERECVSFRTEIREKIAHLGLGKERIEKRGVHISDLFADDWSEMEIYPLSKHPRGHGFTRRSEFFDREVTKIFEQFYPETALLPSHLIHVTCTGYVAPSPAQKLVSNRKGGQSTTVTHAYHMGCYGALSAIRIGAGYTTLPFSRNPANVDIVHTEVSSLHMHPLRHRSEQLLVESLFADGFIKYTVNSRKGKLPGLELLALHEETIPESIHSMSWRCGDDGLNMTLSKDVPVLIARSIDGYLERLCTSANLNREEVMKEAFFAIHPGGPKILQQIKDLLHLHPYQMEHSNYVLKHFGNMSSATLPHIWERMLKDSKIPKNAKVVSMAFGPGLCIAGALFEKGSG